MSSNKGPFVCPHCLLEGHKQTDSKQCLKNLENTAVAAAAAAAAAAVPAEPERPAVDAVNVAETTASAESGAKTGEEKAAEGEESHGAQHNNTQCFSFVTLFSDQFAFLLNDFSRPNAHRKWGKQQRTVFNSVHVDTQSLSTKRNVLCTLGKHDRNLGVNLSNSVTGKKTFAPLCPSGAEK